MASFDFELWQARSLARYKKAQEYAPEEATKRWLEDIAYIDKLAKVVRWMESRGIKADFCKNEGLFEPDTKIIRLPASASPRIQCCVALHESGHFLIGDRGKKDRFGMGYAMANDKHVNRSFLHRCDVVEEEFEAWHRGWKLGRRLRLGLNKQVYDAVKTKSLRSYLKWALRQKGFAATAGDNKDETVVG